MSDVNPKSDCPNAAVFMNVFCVRGGFGGGGGGGARALKVARMW